MTISPIFTVEWSAMWTCNKYETEEVAYAKQQSHHNEFALYYRSDSSLSKREIFSLNDSSSSNVHKDDDVRPVAAVLVHVPVNDDIEY